MTPKKTIHNFLIDKLRCLSPLFRQCVTARRNTAGTNLPSITRTERAMENKVISRYK
ncbi:MAG: hypothetical protein LBP59_08175 [Planctomycetaceae bacterium]|nr:hypothetical protein [Planctomycetaceae bacterium]